MDEYKQLDSSLNHLFFTLQVRTGRRNGRSGTAKLSERILK
jgi:hypothetical protein